MDFFARKISTLYERFDMDKNGLIEEDDFDRWSESLISIGHLSKEQSDLLRKNMKSIWTTYFLPADVDNDLSVTKDELIVYMRSAMADESKRAAINATLPIVFEAVDSNHDDGVQPSEFFNYFKSLGVNDEEFSKKVFAAMDSNNDGELSKEEFAAFGQDFFLSTDESSPSKFFFGPLVA